MGHQLGIDLGTTFTGAAIHRNGRVEVCSLGSRAAAIPSVVLLRDDETVLTGEAAVRRALSEPGRVAREFKRRLGDTTPIILGGSPYSAEALMARLLRSVVDEVSAREGSEPDAITISHPANWGQYKIDLLHQAVVLADLDRDRVTFTTEPAAAATFYAHQERVEPDEVVAVYDLGGGTFDAAVLRAGSEGFEILGRPEGIERLGGIDFDAAVFNHVTRALGDLYDDLDADDPVTQNAVARLRQECVDAKEALSSDTDAVVPVLLPNVQTEVRITRAEFESLIRPALADSIATLRRALRSADVEAEDVAKVLLVGGSSRIPLIAQLVSAELGRPVAVDTHPKHAISMGAAYIAAGHSGVGSDAVLSPPVIVEQTSPAPDPNDMTAVLAPPVGASPSPPTEPMAPVGAPPGPPVLAREADADRGRNRTLMYVGGAIVAALAVVAGVVFFAVGGDDAGDAVDAVPTAPPATAATDDGDTSPEPTVPARPIEEVVAEVQARLGSLPVIAGQLAVEVTGDARGVIQLAGIVDDDGLRGDVIDAATSVDGVTDVTDLLTVRPLDERCSDAVRDRTRWVCLIDVTVDPDEDLLLATYVSEYDVDSLNVNGSFHYHVFGTQIPVDQGGVPGEGPWLVWDDDELAVSIRFIFGTGPLSEKLCMRFADPGHSIDVDSGNCRPIVPKP